MDFKEILVFVNVWREGLSFMQCGKDCIYTVGYGLHAICSSGVINYSTDKETE